MATKLGLYELLRPFFLAGCTLPKKPMTCSLFNEGWVSLEGDMSLFGPDVNLSIEVQAYEDGAGKEYNEGEAGSTYADAQPGSVVLKQGSWLQVVMLGGVPETPGFGSTHLLYDLNTDGAALVDGNSDLHARLALKLAANPALRLILCCPKLTGYPERFSGHIRYELKDRQYRLEREFPSSQVAAFHPIGYPGRYSPAPAVVWGTCSEPRGGATRKRQPCGHFSIDSPGSAIYPAGDFPILVLTVTEDPSTFTSPGSGHLPARRGTVWLSLKSSATARSW